MGILLDAAADPAAAGGISLISMIPVRTEFFPKTADI